MKTARLQLRSFAGWLAFWNICYRNMLLSLILILILAEHVVTEAERATLDIFYKRSATLDFHVSQRMVHVRAIVCETFEDFPEDFSCLQRDSSTRKRLESLLSAVRRKSPC